MLGLSYGLRMLLRKSGTAHALLSIALLTAIITSMTSIINYLIFQTESLGNLVNTGGTYIILNRNSTTISDSCLNANLLEKLSDIDGIEYLLPQRLLPANLTTRLSTNLIYVRGVNAEIFLKLRHASLNGTIAKDSTEANVGEIIANIFSIKVGDEIDLAFKRFHIKVKVVGIFRSRTQSDTEIIIPMETINTLTKENNTFSLIELTLRNEVNIQETLNQISQALSGDVKILQAQQPKEFIQQVNMQTLTFLNTLSTIVYIVVAIASYIIATKTTIEASYEFTMLRVLGAGRKHLFTLIILYVATIALLGSAFGIALGTVTAQAASTLLRWLRPAVNVMPFTEVDQATRILLSTLTSSIIGSLHPSLKPTHMERTL